MPETRDKDQMFLNKPQLESIWIQAQPHYLCANLKSHQILVSLRSPIFTAWSTAPLSLQGSHEDPMRYYCENTQ